MIDFFNKIHGVNDPHTYQTTILGQTIPTDEKLHHYLGLNSFGYYRGGYTVFSTLGNTENNNSNYLYLFNHRTNQLTDYYQWGTNPSGDFHSGQYCLILPDGRILTTNETDHNNQFVVKRSLRPYDITEFETLITITDDIAYPAMNMIGDRIYIIGRTYPLIENGIMYSDDYGETWSSILTILNTGAYANYWAYVRIVHSQNKLMYFMMRFNQLDAAGYDKIYFLQSDDGVNFYNIDNSYTRDVSVLKLSASDLDDYYLVEDVTPNTSFLTDVTSYNDNPYAISQTPTSEDTLDFIYYNGSAWARKTIEISGVPLKDVNKLTLLANSETDFILYAINYDTFSEAPNLDSRVVKITTNDAFDTISWEYLTGVGNFYSFASAVNYSDFKHTAVMSIVLGERGTGTDTEPIGGYSDFTVVDVI